MFVIYICGALIFVGISYRLFLGKLRKRGWNEVRARGEIDFPPSHPPGAAQKEWLFAGPPMSTQQGKHIVWAHYPVYFTRILFLYLVLGPRFLFRLLLSSLKEGKLSYDPAIRPEDIYDLFVDGPLLIAAEQHGDLLKVQVPEMPLVTLAGVKPGGLKLTFNSRTRRIEQAFLQEQDISGDTDRIASLMIMSLAMWAHPQTHVVAEISAREIARKSIQELEPSNRYVVALHQGLLYGPFSPLTRDQPLSINVDKKSGLESALGAKLKHRLSSQKEQFRYYHFLMEARKVLIRLLQEREMEVNPEFLFNNIIVHSVDHHLLYRNLRKINAWSMDGGPSVRSYWRSQVFLAVWVRHVTSAFETEKIGKLNRHKYPFYRALYLELRKIDHELADCILASTSF